MADLGDLSGFLKDASVADLDWLDVDEKDYRELEKLPKQNLDYAPQLEEAWSHEDQPAAQLVPNQGARLTMLDVGEGKVTVEVPAHIIRVARTLLMQNPDPRKLLETLKSKFGSATLRMVRDELVDLLKERAVLGGYYIDAKDFPNCHKADKVSTAFVRRFASQAKFVKASDRCSGCVHNAKGTCGVFQKQIVVDVPYTDELADQVERVQVAKGKAVQASASTDPRERVRLALLAEDVKVAGPAEAPKPVVDPSRFLRKAEAPKKVHLPVLGSEHRRAVESELAWSPNMAQGKVASAKAAQDKKAIEIIQVLRKEMLKGRGERDILAALKLSFSVEDLKSTRDRWEPLFKEAGLYGTVYSTQDSFDDCHEGADFLARQASSVKGIVAGDKCQGCIHNKMSRCLLYGRPLVASAQDLYTPEVLEQTVREHRLAGRTASVASGESIRDSLKKIYREATAKVNNTPLRSYMQAFTGSSVRHVTSGLVKREIVKTAARYMNEGLYGKDLLAALGSRFDVRDIKAAQDELRPILAEQGLQGIFYVDASIYEDYGKGCDEGARLHRSRLVPYVKMGSKCNSCVLQTRTGYCSKYNKALVVEPPYADKLAQQREILASGESTEIPLSSLINGNSHDIRAQFELQGAMQIDLDPEVKSVDVDVELGNAKVKL